MKFSIVLSISILPLCVCVLTGGASRSSLVEGSVNQRNEKPMSDSASGALQRPKSANVDAAWL